MPSLLSFRYERRSVRSRGRGESPAAWRDPVAFENGTRPDTRLSAPWSSRGKKQGPRIDVHAIFAPLFGRF